VASRTFAADISTFVKTTKVKQTKVIRKLAFDAFAGVIMMSPVDTGRFRGNWRISIGTPDLTTIDMGKEDAELFHGAAMLPDELAKLNAAINKAEWGDTVWITNNVVYAEKLEHGHSKQAPAGVLLITFERIKADFSKVVAQVRAAA
jgi:hypothetical protein